MRAVGSLLVTCVEYFIKPPQRFHLKYSSSLSLLLLLPSHSHFTPIKSLHRRSISTTSMGATKVSPDHFTGAWYSVPGLRLRDHRFTVPLDYSLAHQSSCITISVFAREVVAGNSLRLVSPFRLDFVSIVIMIIIIICCRNLNAIPFKLCM